MKKRSNRLSLTVSREMTIALEMLASKSNLGVATQAMVILRQGLDRTIASDAVQIRLKQERAFRTRDQWLEDQSSETFVERALEAASEQDTDKS